MNGSQVELGLHWRYWSTVDRYTSTCFRGTTANESLQASGCGLPLDTATPPFDSRRTWSSLPDLELVAGAPRLANPGRSRRWWARSDLAVSPWGLEAKQRSGRVFTITSKRCFLPRSTASIRERHCFQPQNW
eukprot:scaffold741_cov79-Phaeocystis_antarctica.AAC.4